MKPRRGEDNCPDCGSPMPCDCLRAWDEDPGPRKRFACLDVTAASASPGAPIEAPKTRCRSIQEPSPGRSTGSARQISSRHSSRCSLPSRVPSARTFSRGWRSHSPLG